MCEKQLRVQIKDLFVELREEKEKLLNKIKFLENYRKCLNSFCINCKCDQNIIIENKVNFNHLENKYNSVFGFDKSVQIFDNFNNNLNKINEIIDQNIVKIDENNESVEEVINESVFDIDCNNWAENGFVVNNGVRFELIPKVKEETDEELEIIDLTNDQNNDFTQNNINLISVENKFHKINDEMDVKNIDNIHKSFNYLSAILNNNNNNNNKTDLNSDNNNIYGNNNSNPINFENWDKTQQSSGIFFISYLSSKKTFFYVTLIFI
jgi:hypothetical protein